MDAVEALEREWTVRTIMEEEDDKPWRWQTFVAQKLRMACEERNREAAERLAKILEETLARREIRVRVTEGLGVLIVMDESKTHGVRRAAWTERLPPTVSHIADYVCEIGKDGTIKPLKDRNGDIARIMSNDSSR